MDDELRRELARCREIARRPGLSRESSAALDELFSQLVQLLPREHRQVHIPHGLSPADAISALTHDVVLGRGESHLAVKALVEFRRKAL